MIKLNFGIRGQESIDVSLSVPEAKALYTHLGKLLEKARPTTGDRTNPAAAANGVAQAYKEGKM